MVTAMDDDYDRSDWTPEMIEEERLNDLIGPLFDLWLRFESAFGRLAIDRFDISDEDAEAFAKHMEESGTDGSRAFAYMLRQIKMARILRSISHRVTAIWAVQGERPLSMEDIATEYAKLGEGKA